MVSLEIPCLAYRKSLVNTGYDHRFKSSCQNEGFLPGAMLGVADLDFHAISIPDLACHGLRRSPELPSRPGPESSRQHCCLPRRTAPELGVDKEHSEASSGLS